MTDRRKEKTPSKGDKFDIAAAIAANRGTHDALERTNMATAVIFDTLHQGAGAIADARNSYFDRFLRRYGTASGFWHLKRISGVKASQIGPALIRSAVVICWLRISCTRAVPK